MSGMQSKSGTGSSTLTTWFSCLLVPCVAYWLRPRPSSAYIGIGAVLLGIMRQKKIIGPDAPVQSMDGKKGANVGLGYETAVTLASWGADVTIGCRDTKKADNAVMKIRKHLDGARSGSINAIKLDLTDLESIKEFSSTYIKKNKTAPLDVLINNAGVMAVRKLERTKDGFEMQMGTNHLGHFALTQIIFQKELLPLLERSSDGRIVTVSSLLHTMTKARDLLDNFNCVSKPDKYSAFKVYSKTKLANVLFTYELQKRLDEKGIKITATALEPGIVRTELGRHCYSKWDISAVVVYALSLLIFPITKSPNQGAQTQIWLASNPCLRGDIAAGQYFANSKQKLHTVQKTGPDHNTVASELWELSEKLTKRKFL